MKNIIDWAKTHWTEKLAIQVDTLPPEGIDNMPTKLWPFMWFFIRQIKGLIAAMTLFECIVAIQISLAFWYVGELVKQENYSGAMIMAGIALLLARFVSVAITEGLYHLIYTPYFGNLIRRQLYWYTARQSLSFFQDDFAGRIANKLLQSAPSLRDAVKSTIGAVWFAAIFTISNLWLMAHVHVLLAVPLLCWLVLYGIALRIFVPRIKKYASIHSHVMSNLTGQIVDSFTNFLPTKYFARTHDEDTRAKALLEEHSRTFKDVTRNIWTLNVIIETLNVSLLFSVCAAGLWLAGTEGNPGLAALAMALPMALQATFQSNWIMFEISGIFENIGRVQEGIEALTKPLTVTDKPGAKPLVIPKGKADITFKNVSFNYGQAGKPVLENFNLTIPAGQKVGLVGRSGAGKSTITSLLVRAHDIAAGEIAISAQNIADIQQESLRKHITVVTQDSYLFHRSVLENIRYGQPGAKMEDVIEAATRASAHDFIQNLADNKERTAYEAHVGERGVKLSGGQKQRISIARAILKDAPILILDEATSALDSESEQAIQKALESIMGGKTVIAIAHRLSTLRQMDRIIVMDNGKIIEDGTHEQLITTPNGHYAKLWTMQSGGFITEK
ncbi:MAG: ABC transporter ATP-binding protein [Alphaproteobacteria bacterium]|nr:ABC transporter ATP-binding protein [Alphaproteobacteria bacterium]